VTQTRSDLLDYRLFGTCQETILDLIEAFHFVVKVTPGPTNTQRMDHYFHSEKAINRPGLPQRAPTEYFKDCEIYITCEGDEKHLPEVLTWVADDKMMISGDMPHAEARDNSITEIKECNDIHEIQRNKILGEIAKRFFNL
jgi:hypothetical protein